MTALESTHPGLVQTVLGPVEADALGITSAHEHVLFDMSVWSVSPPEGSERSLFEAPVTWENLHLIRADRPCGYAHIVRNVARLMRAKGLSESQTDRILVQNPSRFLRFH